jgi:phenylacetate-CoA ligase
MKPLSAEGLEITDFNELLQARPLTKQDLRDQCQKISNSGGGFNRHTAGTTGKPLNIQLSRDELAQMLAVREYCFSSIGINLGMREARVWGRDESTIKAKVRNYLLNRRVFCPTGEGAVKIVENLLGWRPEYLYGYASLLLEAADIINKHKLKVEGIRAVVCTAEAILPAQKHFLSSAFCAPVFEEYGSTEFDIIAFECNEGHLHLTNPWLVLEQESGGCLITDISRRSHSFVRYQIGDAVTLKSENCPYLHNGIVIEDLQGRSINQFAYIDFNRKFHIVEFGRALDQYMIEHNDYFGFTIIQFDYRKFQMIITKKPKSGVCYLENWLMKSLNLQLSLNEDQALNIDVTVKDIDDCSEKRTYFVQKIRQH